jgi:hypothetical protein
MIAAVICTPPNFVAVSLTVTFPSSALGLLGGLLSVALGVVQFGAGVIASGWAMSKVAVEQIASGIAGTPELLPPPFLEPEPVAVATPAPAPVRTPAAAPVLAPAPPVVAPIPLEPAVPAPMNLRTPQPVAAAAPPVLVPEPVVRATPAAAAPAVAAPAIAAPVRPTSVETAPQPAATADRPQCPKCSLYETERGSVIGWYCKVCGWRERKSR